AGLKLSVGHVALDPVQLSATSQSPAEGRQVVAEGLKLSDGQLGPDPVQFSAGSHSPPDGRQTVVAGLNASAGHVLLDPVQSSSRSQSPAEARQTVPAFPAGCWQKSLVPLQVSVVHGLPSSVHGVPVASFASGGHAGLGPPPQPSGT